MYGVAVLFYGFALTKREYVDGVLDEDGKMPEEIRELADDGKVNIFEDNVEDPGVAFVVHKDSVVEVDYADSKAIDIDEMLWNMKVQSGDIYEFCVRADIPFKEPRIMLTSVAA